MRALESLLPLAFFVITTQEAVADVVVVDAANGPGADFVSLSAAIAGASEGDVLLVRPGVYTGQPLIIDGKSLTLQADGESVSANQLSVRNLNAGQAVLIRGIDFRSPQLDPALEIDSCQGPVWVEDSEFLETQAPFPGGGILVRQSSAVVLTRCVIRPFMHQFQSPGLWIQQSNVTLNASTVNGPKTGASSISGVGGDGLRLSGSTLVASDSKIVGGAGNDTFAAGGTCNDGGMGGTGAVLQGGATAHFFASQLVGGPGGSAPAPCLQGAAGPTRSVDGTSEIKEEAIGLGSLVQTSPVREGSPVLLDVAGEPGAFAWSLYGTAPTAPFTSAAFLGAAYVSIAPLLLEPLGLIPGSGTFQLTLGTAGFVTPGADAGLYVSQLVTFSPSDRRIRIGAGTLLTVLASTF